MSKLLHVSASPRGSRSESLRLAGHFLDSFQAVNPGVEVEHYDLWDGTLPEFGPSAAAAKMAVFAGEEPVGEAAAWDAAGRTYSRFDRADSYLFSVPMWNHGIPYILKQFIDVVSQPGMVFGFDPQQGYSGLLAGKKAAVIYTSAVYGPAYRPGFGTDFQSTYFNDWLQWAGVDDIVEIYLRPNLVTTDAAELRSIAEAEAREAGKRF
jgi:FMN-dependent NADH-azoreductase